MNQETREFLLDTIDMLVGYDGCETVEDLKKLIDETRERLKMVVDSN